MSVVFYLLAGDLVHIKKFAALSLANTTIEYIGYATPGTNEAAQKWFIKKLIYDVNGFQTDELFANGNASFDKAWSLRTSYSYS